MSYKLSLHDGKQKIWETKDEDVTKLFDKNTPKPTINPKLDSTIAELNKKFK